MNAMARRGVGDKRERPAGRHRGTVGAWKGDEVGGERAALLLALLAFALAGQGNNKSIESALAHGLRPPVPNANKALPVLGSPTRTERIADLRGKLVFFFKQKTAYEM